MTAEPDGQAPTQGEVVEEVNEADEDEKHRQKSPPDWRSVTIKGRLAGQVGQVYNTGAKVYVLKGRGSEGPYTVDCFHRSDNTYDLKDGPKGQTKKRVHEDQLD